jgi:hypothetical protein
MASDDSELELRSWIGQWRRIGVTKKEDEVFEGRNYLLSLYIKGFRLIIIIKLLKMKKFFLVILITIVWAHPVSIGSCSKYSPDG